MAYDYIKVQLAPNIDYTALSDGPYKIEGSSSVGYTVLKGSVTKTQLLAGVPVSASELPKTTLIKVTSLDGLCTSFSEASIFTPPGYIPNTIYFNIQNIYNQPQSGAQIMKVFLQETGSNKPYNTLPLSKNSYATSFPIITTAIAPNMTGVQGIDYTVEQATGSLVTEGDYWLYIKVTNLPEAFAGPARQYDINVKKKNLTTGTIGASIIKTADFSGASCINIGQATSCLTTEYISKYRTGYIDGNTTFIITYLAPTDISFGLITG